MEELELLIPPLKPKPIKSRKNSRKTKRVSDRAMSSARSCDRGCSRNKFRNFTAKDITPISQPEWVWLFQPHEWATIHPVDREKVKQIIVAFSLWGDAYDLTTIFPGYCWRREAVATRLNLLYGLQDLPSVILTRLKDGTSVYALAPEFWGEKIRVFDTEGVIPRWITKDLIDDDQV